MSSQYKSNTQTRWLPSRIGIFLLAAILALGLFMPSVAAYAEEGKGTATSTAGESGTQDADVPMTTTTTASTATGVSTAAGETTATNATAITAAANTTTDMTTMGASTSAGTMATKPVVGDIGNAITHTIVQVTPVGYLNEVNINNDGGAIGNAVVLYNLGTTSKHYIYYKEDKEGYVFKPYVDFTENSREVTFMEQVWDVDDQSTSPGSVAHVWLRDGANTSQNWKLFRNEDGTYYIKNVRTLNAGKDLYLAPEKLNDANGEKLVQSSTPFKWKIQVLTGSYEQRTYSSYALGMDWMSYIEDDRLLSDISIPGTHDSGTANNDFGVEPQSSIAHTQKLYIDEQLITGVRAFDIRCGDSNSGNPIIIHGFDIARCLKRVNKDGYENPYHLSDVMDDFKSFLRGHPTETIIMIVKNDSKKSVNDDITKMLTEYIEEENSVIWRGDGVPTLGEVRGKIVLMHRFEPVERYMNGLHEDDFGLDLTNWDDHNYDHKEAINIYNDVENDVQVWVQDYYDTNGTNKVKYVAGTLEQTSGHNRPKKTAYVFNFTSCTDTTPFTAAREVYKRLYKDYDYLDEGTKAFYGIVMMDYVDAAWAERVYQTNFGAVDFMIKFPEADDINLMYGDELTQAVVTGGSSEKEGAFVFLNSEGVYPTVDLSGQKVYTMSFVAPDGEVLAEERLAITVHQRPITVRPETCTKEYGDLFEIDDSYVQKDNFHSFGSIPYLVTEGSLASFDEMSQLGLYFYARPSLQSTNSIDAEDIPGNYPLGYELKDTVKYEGHTVDARHGNYAITFEGTDYEEAEASAVYYTVEKRTVSFEWQGYENLIAGQVVDVVANAAAGQVLAGDTCSIEVQGGTNASAGTHLAQVVGLLDQTQAPHPYYRFDANSRNSYKVYSVSSTGEIVFPASAFMTYGEAISSAELEGGYAPAGGSFGLVAVGTASDSPSAGLYASGEYLVQFYDSRGEPLAGQSNALTLTVDKLPLEVTLDQRLYASGYGSPLPLYNYDETAVSSQLVLGDTLDSLGIALVALDAEGEDLRLNGFTFDSVAYNNSPAGIYGVLGSASSSDYEVSFSPAYQVITRRVVSFEWQNYLGLFYQAKEAQVTAALTNLVPLQGGDTFDDCSLKVSGGAGVNAGTYRAVIEGLEGSRAANYKLPSGVALYLDYEIVRASAQAVFPSGATLEYGNELRDTLFSAEGSAAVAGDFLFTNPLLVPEVGTCTSLMVFVPSDTQNYFIDTSEVEIAVQKHYRYQTLTDTATGVRVSALFFGDPLLTVVPNTLHNQGTCGACDTIRARHAAGDTCALYEISVEGDYQGEFTVELPVASSLNGRSATIMHCASGMLENLPGTISGGYAKTVTSTLSPFAVVAHAASGPGTDDLANTGDTIGILVLCAVAALGVGGALLLVAASKRRLKRTVL